MLSGTFIQDFLFIVMSILTIALAVWAAITMKMVNFSVMPEPKPCAKLLTHGPYRFVRHPMYSAVLLGCLGACLARHRFLHYLNLMTLIVVLFLKLRREEKLLRVHFEDYERYQSHTSALIMRIL